MVLTISAVDRQNTWEPHWLVELSTTATPKNFSDIDLDVSGTFYHGRVIQDPVVERSFINTFWGWTEQSEVTFRLTNLDGALDAHYNEDPRATLLVVKRYDAESGTNITEFTGVISDIAMGDGWIDIKGVSPDLSFLRQRIPTTIVDTTLFGAYAVNLGVRVPLVFGTVDKAPLLYVNDNTVDNQYDYAVSAGSVSVTAVYRPLPTGLLETVTAGDYTVSTVLYSGYTVIRFTKRQVDYTDNYLSMYADVTGLQTHNPAEAVRMVLASTEYGMLSQTVDETTLVQAIADAEPLVCAGILQEPREAQDILRQLMMMRGMRLGWTSAGAITVTVDKEGTSARMVVRDGEGDGERNLLRITLPRKRRALHEATKDVVIRYKQDYFARVPRLEARKTVRSNFGSDREIEHDFIRDSTTADRVAYYLAKREEFDEQVEVELTQEARQLGPGDLVSTDYAALGGTYYEALRVEKMTDRVKALLGSWSDEFYGYGAGTLPTDRSNQLAQQAADTPAIPTGLALATAVETSSADGALTASVTATWTANTEADLQRYLARLRVSGGSEFAPTEAPKGTEATTWKALLTSTEYAVSIRAEDRFGNRSLWTDEVTIASAKDTTAPPAPQNVTLTVSGLGGMRVTYDTIAVKDLDAVEVYRSTTNDRSTATQVGEGNRSEYFDGALADDTTYYYWLRSRDYTDNVSAFHVGDTSGTSGTTAKGMPYRVVSDQGTSFTGVSSAEVSLGIDAVQSELDVVWIDGNSDIAWGELDVQGAEKSAATVKYAGTWSYIAAASDSTGDLHVAVSQGTIQYARLDASGTSEQSPTTLFDDSDPDTADQLPNIAVSGSSLYWVFRRENINTDDADLMFAKTDLTGSIETSAVSVLQETFTGQTMWDPVIWTDANGNSYIVVDHTDGTNWLTEILKVSASGSVLAGPTTLITESSSAASKVCVGIVGDSRGELHLFFSVKDSSDSGVGDEIFYMRLDTSFNVLTPLISAYTDSKQGSVRRGGIRIDSATDDIYLIRRRQFSATPGDASNLYSLIKLVRNTG